MISNCTINKTNQLQQKYILLLFQKRFNNKRKLDKIVCWHRIDIFGEWLMDWDSIQVIMHIWVGENDCTMVQYEYWWYIECRYVCIDRYSHVYNWCSLKRLNSLQL